MAGMLYRYRVLSLLFFLSIITYLDRVCISVAGPRMQKDLNLSPEMWGWVVGAFTLAYAAFEIPSGAMADRVGPRRVLTRIVIWWSVFTTLTGAVSNFVVLMITRFLFGAGEAGAYPTSSSAISKWFPTEERAKAHGVVWMASRVGGAVAPLLVVPLQIAYGWRASFFVFGILGLIWAVIWYTWYRDHPSQMPGVTQAEMDVIRAPSSPVAHVGLPWGEALKKKNFLLIMLMYHTYCWGSYFYLSWLHTYLQKGRGFTEGEMKIYSVLPFVAGAFGNLFGGWASDKLVHKFGLRIGRRTVGALGLALSGVFLMSTALTTDKNLAVLFLTLGYGSMDCMLPVAWAVCLDVGRKYSGTVTGSMNMAGQMGSFLSSVAFGYMVTYFGNYNQPLIPLASMLFVSAFLFTRIDPTEQLIAAGETAG
jgi:ACS family glucarate transporter-like MFS transporter